VTRLCRGVYEILQLISDGFQFVLQAKFGVQIIKKLKSFVQLFRVHVRCVNILSELQRNTAPSSNVWRLNDAPCVDSAERWRNSHIRTTVPTAPRGIFHKSCVTLLQKMAKPKAHPKPAGTKPLNMNLDTDLLAKVQQWRFRHMHPTLTGAVEALLAWAVEQNPNLKPKD
jgi:hypothetical protein